MKVKVLSVHFYLSFKMKNLPSLIFLFKTPFQTKPKVFFKMLSYLFMILVCITHAIPQILSLNLFKNFVHRRDKEISCFWYLLERVQSIENWVIYALYTSWLLVKISILLLKQLYALALGLNAGLKMGSFFYAWLWLWHWFKTLKGCC